MKLLATSKHSIIWLICSRSMVTRPMRLSSMRKERKSFSRTIPSTPIRWDGFCTGKGSIRQPCYNWGALLHTMGVPSGNTTLPWHTPKQAISAVVEQRWMPP